MPTQLGNLTNLTQLNLANNQLSGNIPTQLGNLTNLTQLNLGGIVGQHNQLTGNIPIQLGNLTNLTLLDLDANYLSGGIPVELGSLTNLTRLSLGANYLTGTMPTQLSNLTRLTELDISFNELSGSIPSDISNLVNLVTLRISYNFLGGSIPSQLGNLAASQGGNLTRFDFCGNYLTGALPVPLRSGVMLGQETLNDWPASGSYDPVACQRSGSPPVTTPTTTPAVVVPFVPFVPPVADPPASSSTTTTTTTTTATTTTTVAAGSASGTTDTRDSEEPSGPVWNTLTVQPGGTTASQIRRTLGLASRDTIYAWDTTEQRWQRTTPTRTIPAGTAVSFRTEQRLSQDNLEELNLGTGTRRTTLTTGWNLLSTPTQIQQPQTTTDTTDGTDTSDGGFLFASELLDCDSPTAILAVASYSPATQQWQLWLPCHPSIQTRLTTGDNPPYQSLTSISPQDTTYIYTRTRQPVAIAWNPDTSQYQPG